MVNPITNHKTNTEMTDFKSVLKSNIKLVEPKISKRNVKITCHNKNAGSKVISTISQNSRVLFGGYTMKDISSGVTDKDFTVKMELRDGAQTFYDNLMDILNDNTVPEQEPEKSNYQQTKEKIEEGIKNTVNTMTSALGMSSPAVTASNASVAAAPAGTAMPGSDGDSGSERSDSNKTLLIVGGAVLLVIIIGLVIWKSKK